MAPESSRARCGDDESLFEYAQGGLRADERRSVEAHVNTCPDCRRVLAEALRGLAAASGDESAEGSRGRIGRYSLVELLGAGASGVVYRAFDPELERTVALKLLRTDASETSLEHRERRLREARTMAKVSDPNVVTVFDAGLSGGAVYIVMEYVQGSTLEEWLSREPRTMREIVDAFLAAGRGLAALHARALVHRDFKPENVMVGKDGRIQVTDFGLARPVASVETTRAERAREAAGGAVAPASRGGPRPPVNGAAGERSRSEPRGQGPHEHRVTLTHGVFGTPAYMAPELFTGKPADAQSDQFSFAVALLSAATGHHPFGADEHISVSELVLRMHRDPRELAEKASGLPGRLRDSLVRALSVDPEERFPSMGALLSELERAPIPAARGTSRKAPWVAVLTLAVVGAALALNHRSRREHEEPTPSVEPAVLASPPTLAVVTEPAAGEIETAPAASSRPEAPRAPEKTVSPPSRAAKAATTATARRNPHATPAPSESRYDDRLKDPF